MSLEKKAEVHVQVPVTVMLFWPWSWSLWQEEINGSQKYQIKDLEDMFFLTKLQQNSEGK